VSRIHQGTSPALHIGVRVRGISPLHMIYCQNLNEFEKETVFVVLASTPVMQCDGDIGSLAPSLEERVEQRKMPHAYCTVQTPESVVKITVGSVRYP
jgi:hypothetical protein